MQSKVTRTNKGLQVNITASPEDAAYHKTVETDKINIYGSLAFQAKQMTYKVHRTNQVHSYDYIYKNIILVCVHNTDDNDKCKYKIKLNCPKFNLEDILFYSEDNLWHIINENENSTRYTFELSLQVDCLLQINYLDLYEDEQLTDFQLKAKDGTVNVHKSYLAATSAFFKSKLVNDSKDNILELPETSLRTLQDFKRCIYLDILPNENLEELLLVASYFKIKALEYKCVDKMLTKMGSDVGDAINIFDFSLKHRHMPLFLGIMEYFQSGNINICEIRKYYLKQ